MKRHIVSVERGMPFLVGLAVTCIAIGLGVAAVSGRPTAPRQAGDHASARATTTTETAARAGGVHADDARDFRLLLTVLAGVALGAAAAALPTLLQISTSDYWAIVGWLLWSTSVVAVILIYLATLFGSKLLRNEVDLTHSAALVAVFLAQCAMFATLAVAKEDRLVRDWLVAFAAFAAAAVITIYMVLRALPSWWRYPDKTEQRERYRHFQLIDMACAAATAALSVLFVVIRVEFSRLGTLVVGGAAFASMVGACWKQYADRRRLAGLI